MKATSGVKNTQNKLLALGFAKDWLCNRYQSQEMGWGSAAPEQKVPTEERRQKSMQAKFMCSKFTYLFLLLFMITIIQTTEKYKPFLPFTDITFIAIL